MRTPKHYREMAEEVRTCGDLVTAPDCKRRLYECAGQYEAWADQAEDVLRTQITVRSISWPKRQ